MEEHPSYITLMAGRNGWIIVQMNYSKSFDMYQITSTIERKVYKDKAQAATRAVTIGMERKLEVRL
jgi:hypothetical protein